MKRSSQVLSLFLISILFIGSCKESLKESSVRIWEISDPEMLQPLITLDDQANTIMQQIFQPLLSNDPKTLELIPVLAESRPMIEKTSEGKMRITFLIRKEAKWSDGSQVTGKDVEFTIKAMLNPAVNNPGLRSTLDFVSEVVCYPEAPRKITIICNSVYFLSESVCGSLLIMPEYFYDPKGLMRKYSVGQLRKEGQKLATEAGIKEFADDMNSELRMRDKDHISGSGPYQLTSWIANQRLTLTKKKAYWGDQISIDVPLLVSSPDKLIYITIKDQNSALSALKSGDLDVLMALNPKDYMELQKDESFKKRFHLYSAMNLAYSCICLNTKCRLLSGKKTRQAMCMLTDINRMIETLYYGQATRLVGPIHPSDVKNYNSSIPLYEFDPGKAKALLKEDGWEDADGDGILEKLIDGEKKKFEINFTINAEGELRKYQATILQEDARKVGIKINIVPQEWNTLSANMRKHNLDMFSNAWVLSPSGDDLKQLFHSESALPDGDNFVNFSNPVCDSLLTAITTELNEEKRAELLKQVQLIIHEEAPFIFLFSPAKQMAISRRFRNTEVTVLNPGFNPAWFKAEKPE